MNAHKPASVPTAIAARLRACAARFRRHLRGPKDGRAQSNEQLLRLDDRLLRDMGVERSEIEPAGRRLVEQRRRLPLY